MHGPPWGRNAGRSRLRVRARTDGGRTQAATATAELRDGAVRTNERERCEMDPLRCVDYHRLMRRARVWAPFAHACLVGCAASSSAAPSTPTPGLGASCPADRTTFDEAVQRATLGAADQGEELSHAEITGPLRAVDLISRCLVPLGMRFSYALAIRHGCAVGVTVTTRPRDAGVESCIDREIRGLRWKVTGRLETYAIYPIDL